MLIITIIGSRDFPFYAESVQLLEKHCHCNCRWWMLYGRWSAVE